MRIGDLRHRVTIQQKGFTQDAEGVITEFWADVATVWAAIEDLSGREYFAAKSVNDEMSTRICIRYRQGIEPEMRVINGSRVYDIITVLDPDGRKRELHLMCKVAG